MIPSHHASFNSDPSRVSCPVGAGYWVYRYIKSIPGAVWNGVKDLSGTVQESGSQILNKASEELPGAIRAVSGAVGGAVGGAKKAITPHWEWVKKEVEERRKGL